jgi:hypothetical protein
MGQLLPDRLFWARDDGDAPGDGASSSRLTDARHSH